MKKIFLLIITLFLTFTLISCGTKNINLNGGEFDPSLGPSSNLSFVEAIESTPIKEGYVFAGWYEDASFNNYINPEDVTFKQKISGKAHAKWIIVPEYKDYYIREEVATITDSGRNKQKMDVIPVSEDYNITDLMRAGYRFFSVIFLADVKEIDDGYQYVFFYNDSTCYEDTTSDLEQFIDDFADSKEKDPALLFVYEHEHGPGAVMTTWGEIQFKATIGLDLLVQNIYIRYGAAGKKEDTWQNANVMVRVTPIK